MTSLKALLTRPLRQLPSSLVVIVLIVALLGFGDAIYLTVEHYQNVIPPCTTGGCEKVLTSAYSTVAGIPISLIGSVYYFIVLVGAFAYLEGKRTAPLRFGLQLVVIGFIVSVILVGLQAFVIHSFCTYCLGSAGITTVLFILAMIIFKKYSGDPASALVDSTPALHENI